MPEKKKDPWRNPFTLFLILVLLILSDGYLYKKKESAREQGKEKDAGG